MYKDSPTILAFFKNIATGISSVIRPWDGFERIAEKLVNLPDHAYTEIYKEYMPLENGFNVLLHSDLWTNNILFHYDEQNALDDIRLVGKCRIYLISAEFFFHWSQQNDFVLSVSQSGWLRTMQAYQAHNRFGPAVVCKRWPIDNAGPSWAAHPVLSRRAEGIAREAEISEENAHFAGHPAGCIQYGSVHGVGHLTMYGFAFCGHQLRGRLDGDVREHWPERYNVHESRMPATTQATAAYVRSTWLFWFLIFFSIPHFWFDDENKANAKETRTNSWVSVY